MVASPKLTTVELFSGIGGFRLACDYLGIDTILANDLNVDCATVYKQQFGKDVFVQGDIQKLLDQIPSHDILTGGFPCQPFSNAGKKLGIKDARGNLFNHIIEVIKKGNPKYFILENVKGILSRDKGKHFSIILHAFTHLGYDLEWRLLNLKHFGLPQNRERVIIIGHRKTNISKSYLVSDAEYQLNKKNIDDPFNKWSDLLLYKQSFPNWGLVKLGKWYGCSINPLPQIISNNSLRKILEPEVPLSEDYQKKTLTRIQCSEVVNRYINGVEVLYNQKGGARMGYTIYGIKGLAPTLTSSTSRHYERYKIHNKYRRLTPIEYARLQGFPDDHCANMSNSKQYKLYGNAVPPVVVKWVIQRLINEKFITI